MAKDGGGTSVWEWAAAALSTVLVLAMAAFMVRQGLRQRDGVPEIAVSVDRISKAGDHFRVEFSARNTGDATAAGLNVQGELRADSGRVETSDVTLDYVPAGARRKAVLWFTRDPRAHPFEIRPTGHDVP